MTARFLIGDVFDGLATLADESVDLVFSSPPFLALRSYLPADHPDKPREIGSEATPAEFLDRLLDVVEACDRVLAPHGTLCFELGDTYSGSGGAGGDYLNAGMRDGQPRFDGSAARARADGGAEFASAARRGRLTTYADARGNPDGMRDSTFSGANTRTGGGPGWPEAKSLCMIPQSFAWAIAYGRNPFTGRETPRWRVRNLVAWCRPNPPVGALGDKFRPATSYLTVACKAKDRYFDLDAVRDPAPPLDFWVIPTEPYEGSHYAAFPRALVVKPVKAMCPRRVCTVCGEPSRRIVGEAEYDRTDTDRVPARLAMTDGARVADGVNQHRTRDGANPSVVRNAPTLGWTDCGHDAWRAGCVLDPFVGSGTTLAVATGHGLDAIGIDIDERNAQLALERVGPMLLEIVSLSEGAA